MKSYNFYIFVTVLLYLFQAVQVQIAHAQEIKDLKKTVHYMDPNRRPFNTYAPYAYEYYYPQRDGNNGCSWVYTARGLVYSCQ